MMDEIEMDFNEPSPNELSDSSGNCVFKTPMAIHRYKLHPVSTHDSSGYVSLSSPELNSSCGSSCQSIRQTNRIAVHQNVLYTPNVLSSELLLPVSPENSLCSNVIRSIEVSPDSGIDSASFCSSLKDSRISDLDEDLPAHVSQTTKCSVPCTIPGSNDANGALSGCSAFASGHKLWQSTPVFGDARISHPAFVNSCELEKSPTKRRRSLRRSSRDLFQSSKRKATFPLPLIWDQPSTSSTNQTNFIGKEKVDFLFYLGKHSIHQPALDAILGYLDPADLCRATLVSKSWKNVVESVPTAMLRKRDYVDECIQTKENLPQSVKKSEGVLPFRGQLIAIQNFSRTEDVSNTESRSPPVSPSKVRFNLYLKEGRKLENGQTLIQCPQCKLPSRKETDRSARCTRRGCQYYFCILCLCKFHGDKSCPVSSVRHRKRQTAIGSRESRRNLQRLCK